MENRFTKKHVANALAVLSTATIAFTIALMFPGNVTAQHKKVSHTSSTATLVCDAGAGGSVSVSLFGPDGTTLVGFGIVECAARKTHGDKSSVKISTDVEAVSAFAAFDGCSAGGSLPFTTSCNGLTLTVK
jgi:hypothetical protein